MSNTQFAVIKTGGKQYKVAEGDVVKIAKISDTAKVGETLSFDEVLLKDTGTATTLGKPTISGAKVTAELIEIGRAKKVTAVRYKSKSRTFIRRGHRQDFFKIKITKIA